MSQKSETTFKNRIRPLLDILPNTFCEKIQQVGISGTPDLLLCVAGLFVAMELKKDSKSNITRLQLYKLQKIYAAGGIGLIVSPENWELIYDRIKCIANDGRKKESSFRQLRVISRQQLYAVTGPAHQPQIQEPEVSLSSDEDHQGDRERAATGTGAVP